MTARGAFIGPIIDDLDTISSRVRARSKLGLTDLNRVLEDFFKELLNHVFKANLTNLNEARRNAPGLDLGHGRVVALDPRCHPMTCRVYRS